MASTFSTNLAIELMGTGDQAGTWGTTTNTNLGTLIEQAISGYQVYSCSGGTDVLTIPNGAPGVARNMYIELQGTGGGTVTVPTGKAKLYFVYNNTSSGTVSFIVASSTGITIPNGARVCLVSNGTNLVVATNYLSSLTLGSPLPILSGGTGSTTATGYGSTVLSVGPSLVTPALGTPTSGLLTNCTGYTTGSLSGTISLTTQVSGILPVANGGTGASSISSGGVVIGNGSSTPTTIAPSTSGNVLVSNGTNWTSAPVTSYAITSIVANAAIGA